jgi:hypothetical protein
MATFVVRIGDDALLGFPFQNHHWRANDELYQFAVKSTAKEIQRVSESFAHPVKCFIESIITGTMSRNKINTYIIGMVLCAWASSKSRSRCHHYSRSLLEPIVWGAHKQWFHLQYVQIIIWQRDGRISLIDGDWADVGDKIYCVVSMYFWAGIFTCSPNFWAFTAFITLHGLYHTHHHSIHNFLVLYWVKPQPDT